MDATRPNVIAFVDRLLQRVVDLANGTLDNGAPRAFLGYVSLRYTSGSFPFLAMQRFTATVAFEVAGLGRVHGTEPFLRAIEADAVQLGGAMHGGQRNNQKMKTIERIWDPAGPFGNLFLWRKQLSQLSENGRTFSTDFTRQRGLEIIQPILADFAASLTATCSGETTRVSWDATNNPPATRISLLIRPAGSTATVPPTFIATELNGFRDVTVPAGNSRFTLVASLALNGRTLTDKRTLDVRGFAGHDVWTFELDAQCMTVNGASRWAVPLTLGSQFISNNLTVEELTGSTGTFAKWHARIPGHPDVGFGPASPTHILAAPPTFNVDWLFFFDSPGCSGPPPEFHLEVQTGLRRVIPQRDWSN